MLPYLSWLENLTHNQEVGGSNPSGSTQNIKLIESKIMKNNEDIKYMVIPDVHGREFWREPVKNILHNTEATIVFLGDYLDPYAYEFPNAESLDEIRQKTIEIFKEILEIKKENNKRVILLLGNHDCTYMISKAICDVRADNKNYNKIAKLFSDNKALFQLAYEARINKRHFIFSHAGISRVYAESCFGGEVNEDNVVELFNKDFREENYELIESLGQYSKYRGYSPFDRGSLIWADAREWELTNPDETYGYQIVGHTQLYNPYIGKYISFLDTHDAYIINSEGEIEKYN